MILEGGVNEVLYVKAAFKRENSVLKSTLLFSHVRFVLSLLLYVYSLDQLLLIRFGTLHDSSERVGDLLCTIYYFTKFERS